jgi:glycine cleavage system H protein
MSRVPDDLRYTEEHEWVKAEDGRVRIGVTDHAQEELTDVVYVELPTVGGTVNRGEEFAVLESVKAVSEIYAPVSGKVVAVNEALEDKPELINEDPYGEGWIALIEVDDMAEWESLLDAAAYKAHIGE